MSNLFEGDYSPKPITKTTNRQLKALQKYGLPYAQALQNIASSIEPQQQALNYNMFSQYGPLLSQIGSQIQEQEAGANIGADIRNIQGGGRELLGEAISLDRMANPEFYAMREATGKGYTDLIGGMDPNKLSGSEMANVERGVNRLNARTGNINTGDATTTASNALTFDDRLQAKRDRFGQALSLFPGLSTASQSNINAYPIASGRGATQPNVGTAQFQQGQFGQQTAQGLAQNIQEQGLFRQQLRGNQRPAADFGNQSFQALGSAAGGMGGGCCFIFMAAYEGEELPRYIRQCRDFYYNLHPSSAVGYKRMARWLVPMMHKSKLVMSAVKWSMIKPMSWYGQWLTGKSKTGWLMKPIKSFWINTWRLYATI